MTEIGKVELGEKSIFSMLEECELGELKSCVKRLHFKRGDYIYEENDEPSGMLYLHTGKVKIFKEGVGGRDQIVRMVSSNGMVGYRSMLAHERHISAAVALEESEVYLVPKECLFGSLINNSKFVIALLRDLALELGDSNQRTLSLTQKHIRGRLAESLILLKEKYGYEKDGGTLRVYLSREDIANLSNMTTSNAIRTLSSFVNDRLVAIDGRKIRILDIDELEKISKLG